ncbi:MAG: hypothetical protein A2Y15_03470 [Clostridiales bacterium GWF2_36_10]|nr:MAG: hypothetical protein A2Y15_03470 [Clostridiales bacterium GWF2_36_10]HAN20794.1 hypothetical protein [Clostridiales bacterium]
MLIYSYILINNITDSKKFLQVYEIHKKKMLYIAYNILHNQFDAEDAVQKALLAIARHMNAIDKPSDYKTSVYVTKTTKNMALKILQKRKHNDVSFDSIDYEISDTIDFIEQLSEEEEVKIVLRAIYKLDDTYRDVLCYHFLNELSTKEIADLLGRKHNTVKSQLKRGKEILLTSLKREVSHNEK